MSLQFNRFPSMKYNGLTIVLSNPSRFDMDSRKLLSGKAGIFFEKEACKGILLAASHITIVENFIVGGLQLLPATKVVLLLGQVSLDYFCKNNSQLIEPDITLNQQRGSPIFDPATNIIYIVSYLPQDTHDFKSSYEKDFNSYKMDTRTLPVDGEDEEAESESEEKESEQEHKSTKGKTKRGNYRFWLRADTQKAINFLAGRARLVEVKEEEVFKIYENSEVIIEQLLTHKNEDFYFDIETDRLRNITCFGFSFGLTGAVFVVPLLRHDYSPAYTDITLILRALSIALRDNTCVGHNIYGFDLFVICHDYGIPIGEKNYDTMIAHHRLYPEIEKSLGHGISYYTTLPYHKGEAVFEPRNIIEEQQHWRYNGHDVYALKFLKQGIDAKAKEIRAEASIEQANESIVPYLTITLTGIRYSKEKLDKLMTDNDRKLNAILKLIKYFVGYTLLPTSPKQCVTYFHEILNMPIVSRTDTNKPKLDEKNLLKLYTMAEHPMIPLCIYYRQIVKESGALKFVPWQEEEATTNNQQLT